MLLKTMLGFIAHRGTAMKYKRIKNGLSRKLKNGKILTITGWALNWVVAINGNYIDSFEYVKLARAYADENFE